MTDAALTVQDEDDLVAALTDADLEASLCRQSFKEFVLRFWASVPGAGAAPLWNWHLDVFVDELEVLARRVAAGLPREHDVIFNVPFGTSKSSVISILFPAWVWTFFPQCRFLVGTHTDKLVLDLATKSRAVITSEGYRVLFPEVVLRDDQDTKEYFANTLGGDRNTCTVGGKTPMGFHAHILICDDPIDPMGARSEAELDNAEKFVTDVIPTRKVDKAVTVTILVMQRIHYRDPTAVMLRESRKPGAARVRHVCLPGELMRGGDGAFLPANVSPPELARRYVAGLLDPARLPLVVLDEYRARGAFFYATQVLQDPQAPGSGMFKSVWFSRRAKAAPYHAQRVRFWDRAASTGEDACFTAGVLLAFDGTDYYVEDVVHGRWEPDERNAVMRATALRDRARYGPRHEPRILVETEGGSSGRDAWKGVARALAGFPAFEERVTGSKDVRAEPWAAQLAAGTVVLVDDGRWDVAGYVEEHVRFRPEAGKRLGKYKDMVDSSSGAFNWLARQKGAATLRSYPLRAGKGTGVRILVADVNALALTAVDQAALLVWCCDPAFASPESVGAGGIMGARNGSVSLAPAGPLTTEAGRATGGVIPAGAVGDGSIGNPIDPPPHLLAHCLATHVLPFADLEPADHQETWGAPVSPWDRPAAELVLDQQAAKRLWAFLLKKRDPAPLILAFASPGGRRALAVAYAVADALRLPRTAVWAAHDPEVLHEGKPPPCPHAYATVKAARALVVG